MGKYSLVTDVLNKAVEIDSQNGDFSYRLAEEYNNLDKYSDALTASNTALQYLKRNQQAHAQIEKGKAYEGLGDFANAVASYREVGIDKRFASWINWKIDILKKQSQ